jgi:diguanylate cyclase (GGDEF)-like protein
MRLLIAEDDCVTRRVLETMLRKWGHEVVVACDGHQAWQMLQEPTAPKLVVLDWMMPGMDGIDVCRKVRALPSDIRPHIILLTGKQQVKDLVEGIVAGADDYMSKPFEPAELKVRIHAGERVLQLQAESLEAREALRHQATHDGLTGLANRAAILQRLQQECHRSQRSGLPLCVILADVDHFKKINDVHGHQAGDLVLEEVAGRLATAVRSYEQVGRYGGEEFLAVVCDCDLAGGQTVAQRLCELVAQTPVPLGENAIPVTLSLGVVCSSQLTHCTPDELVRAADAAMYAAKRNGRNRVEWAVPQLAVSSLVA